MSVVEKDPRALNVSDNWGGDMYKIPVPAG